MAVSIRTLNAGNMTIGSGNLTPASHPETRVKYTAESELPDATFNIVGELTSSQIDDINNLEEIYIGNTVTSIGDGAFAGAQNLLIVMFGNNIESVGSGAFATGYPITFTIGKEKSWLNEDFGDGFSRVAHWYIAAGTIFHCTDGEMVI